jgi:hypothetical protein
MSNPANPVKRTHGLSKTPTYKSWMSMRERCTRPTIAGYHLYGGRGIKVCARWLSFENFVADMGIRPDGKTLDRISSDGDYEPGNCRWATVKEQARNTRSNVRLQYMGESRTVSEIAAMSGIKDTTLRKRLFQMGLTVEEATSLPLRVGPGLPRNLPREAADVAP